MRILIADGDLRVRAALHVLFDSEDLRAGSNDAPSISECSDLEGLATLLREFEPDLLLLDWELPGPAAAAFLAARGHVARPRLVVLSTHPEIQSAALAMGADGFASKADAPEVLLAVCRRVMRVGQAEDAIDVAAAGAR